MPRVRIDPSSRLPFEDAAELPPLRPLETKTHEYVELMVRSNFSFLQGASSPETLMQRAVFLGYGVVAITDRDGLYGAVRAHEEAKKAGIRLVLGCEITLEVPGFRAPRDTRRGGTMTLHVENHAGYTNLCRILTESHQRHPKGKPRKKKEGVARNVYAEVPIAFVAAHAEGLWALVHHPEHIAPLKEAFGERLSVAVHRHLDGEDRVRVGALVREAAQEGVPLCATNVVRYAEREQKLMYDVLHCIREQCTLDQAGRALSCNAEAHLKSEEEMKRLFRDHPSAIARTRVIADACRFSLEELSYRFPSEIDDPAFEGETPDQALRRLTYSGAELRYEGNIPAKVTLQIEKELDLITTLEVAPYFLSVRIIVDIARRRDILCQGRGSAANSAVCYCLGVTAVDPARSNLLFERFLSAERREPPDIDIDFEHERREEVIQELYQKYGRDRAAMVSEVICYRGKSALREVGKVFGLSLEQVERLSAVVSWWDTVKGIEDERLQNAGFDPKDTRVRQVLAFSQAIQGFPRHLSIHVGGFVLSSEPLVNVAPIEPATMKDRTVIPWDKDDIETLGFFKVDVLGLGILSAIRRTLDMTQGDPRIHAATAIDRLAKIPAEDPDVYEALCHADTVGVFQIESRAQMSMLPRLKPRVFYDLVVEVAIVRPGPIQGGMIHPYLRRRNGQESPVSPHPCLSAILDRTLGVPLFQEQVMQIAIVGAGYTGGEADQLRRDMAAWKKSGRLERHHARLLEGFAARGISADFAARLYAQIQGFAEYGFPESHAASFALLVYASSWLKVHHPAAFAAALVNSQPMGFYSPSTLLQDAQKHGVELRAICIHKSHWDCTLESRAATEHPERDDGVFETKPALRIGLRQVKGLGEESARRIEASRLEGDFRTIEDLSARASLSRVELEHLAESGALEPLVSGRKEAIWKVRAPRGEGLFTGLDLGDALPQMPALTRAEQLSLDYERTGLSVNDHPMKLLRQRLPVRVKSSRGLSEAPHGSPISVAGLVICRQRPATASGVVFVTMEDELGFLNLILYAHVFEKLRHVATTSALLLAHGKVEKEGEVVYVIVERLEALRVTEANLPAMSRDFH